MPIIAQITQAHLWFKGEDKVFRFAVYADAALTTPVDVTTWSMSWKLSARPGIAAAISKATGGNGITLTGTFNVNPASNTQRVLVAVADDNTEGLPASTWWHELKRTDAGSEAVIAHGSAELLEAVHTT